LGNAANFCQREDCILETPRSASFGALLKAGKPHDIRDRDILTDDEDYRYQVGGNYWTSMGYQLSTIREEA
jgi:hypothetical protein